MSATVHGRPSRTSHRTPLPSAPITTRRATSAGWSRAAQRHALRTGAAVRLRRAVLCGDVDLTELQKHEWLAAAHLREARSAALTCERAALSHTPAAVALGLPTLTRTLTRPCLTVQSGTALRELATAHLHRATITDVDVLDIDGYRTLAVPRTILDLAREHGVAAGVIAADHALREGLTDLASLIAAWEVCARWPGRRAARITLLSSDGSAESPLESLSRLGIAAHGLPTPVLQPRIADHRGRFIGRCDFYWDEFGVVGEADGNLKYAAGGAAVVAERARETALRRAGLIVVRWGWSDVRAFGPVAEALRSEFRRGVVPGSRDRRWEILPPAHTYPSGLHLAGSLSGRHGAR